jgi:hypothetical protein
VRLPFYVVATSLELGEYFEISVGPVFAKQLGGLMPIAYGMEDLGIDAGIEMNPFTGTICF